METEITINQKIINTLLLNASFIDNPGLMHGKMGISIYFYHLARQTQNKIYEDYAGELIDEIYEEITLNTPAGFENGLAGIGWGIEYLVQNNFIEADTDEVLEEFDNRIFKELIYNTPKEIGLLDGILGISFYFLKRIQNTVSNDEKIPTLTNKQALIHVIDELDRKTQNITEIISEPLISPNNCRTIEPSNPQTPEKKFDDCSKWFDGCSKRSSTVVRTLEPLNLFDLTWDYPVLLWFLAELYEQNIFNFKAEKIIQRLIEPLLNETNYPVLQSNKLLLALALTKLQKIINNKPVRTVKPGGQQIPEQSNLQTQTPELPNFKTIIDTLLTLTDRNIIKSELFSNDAIFRYGIPGIAWIYKQLYKLTLESKFENEFEYWTNQNLFNKIENNNSADGIRNINTWGLLEGYSGYLLIGLMNTKAIKRETQPNPCKK